MNMIRKGREQRGGRGADARGTSGRAHGEKQRAQGESIEKTGGRGSSKWW